jgi:hypothetical protein
MKEHKKTVQEAARRTRRAIAGAAVAAIASGFVAPLVACSVLLDWNGFTGGDSKPMPPEGGGGPPDHGTFSDAPSTLLTCGTNQQCSPAVPGGWSGPLVLFDGNPGSVSLPSCPSGYSAAYEGKGGFDAGAATCSRCSCSVPQAVTCSPPQLTFYSDTQCSNVCGADAGSAALTTTACAAVPSTSCALYYAISSSAPSGGSCNVDGGVATIPAITWSDNALACTPVSLPERGSCRGGELCLPAPAQPFPPRFCVLQSGAATSCPSSGYTDGPHVYYADQVDDTRACSACDCGPVSGATCRYPPGGVAGFPYFDTSCGVPSSGPFSVPAPCVPVLTMVKGFRLGTLPNLNPGQCSPVEGTGAPMGAATPTNPTSLCCTP